jgi:hypothetical protein
MNRSLDSLDPRMQIKAFELIARLVERGIQVMIINTRRTDAEQAEALRTGHSTVPRSKHQDGLAIDLCPYDTWMLHGSDKLHWDTTDPIWFEIGKVAESLGLRWGGRFKPLNAIGLGWDPGHSELVIGSSAATVPV